MSDPDFASARTLQRRSANFASPAAPTARLPHQGNINFAESLIIALFAAPLAVIGGLIWASPAFDQPRQSTVTYSDLAIGSIEQAAYKDTTRSFDEHYQRHIGVLDVLKFYPEP